MARTNNTGLLSVPKLGAGQAPELVESMGGRTRAAKVLRVDQQLLNMWISGQLEAPTTALLAMFWQSNHGFTAAFSESHWTHQYNSMLKNEARARVELLEAYIHDHGLPPPAGRLTTHKEMLTAGPYEASSFELHRLASLPDPALHKPPGRALQNSPGQPER